MRRLLSPTIRYAQVALLPQRDRAQRDVSVKILPTDAVMRTCVGTSCTTNPKEIEVMELQG